MRLKITAIAITMAALLGAGWCELIRRSSYSTDTQLCSAWDGPVFVLWNCPLSYERDTYEQCGSGPSDCASTGTGTGTREWGPVNCDTVPYGCIEGAPVGSIPLTGKDECD